MLGVVLSDNVIILYLFWEPTSFLVFYLFHSGAERQASIYGTQKIAHNHSIWWSIIYGGIILLAIPTQSFSIQYMIQHALKFKIAHSSFCDDFNHDWCFLQNLLSFHLYLATRCNGSTYTSRFIFIQQQWLKQGYI